MATLPFVTNRSRKVIHLEPTAELEAQSSGPALEPVSNA